MTRQRHTAQLSRAESTGRRDPQGGRDGVRFCGRVGLCWAGGGVGDGQLVSRGLAWDLASRTRSTAWVSVMNGPGGMSD